jgi:hypothetical protein
VSIPYRTAAKLTSSQAKKKQHKSHNPIYIVYKLHTSPSQFYPPLGAVSSLAADDDDDPATGSLAALSEEAI